MANEVYANNMEISCKAASGKSIAAFPDVCFTPPPTPLGVPIPYPNTGLSKDTTKGTRTIRITRKEVMLKNKSYYKTSYGDEPGRAPKKGIITSKIKGKVYFTSWSMNVKFESKNVVRHMDLTTHNHASFPGNTPVWPYFDQATVGGGGGPCRNEARKEKRECADFKPYGRKNPCAGLGAGKPSRKKGSGQAERLADKVESRKCLVARRCALQPYKPNSCCPQQTGHHLIESSALFGKGRGRKGSIALEGVSGYSENHAPCVCVEGATQSVGTHGLMHTYQSASAAKAPKGTIMLSNGKSIEFKKTTYGTAKKNAVKAMGKVFSRSRCSEECLSAQLDNYHKQCGINNRTTIKAVQTGSTDTAAADRVVKKLNKGSRGQGGR